MSDVKSFLSLTLVDIKFVSTAIDAFSLCKLELIPIGCTASLALKFLSSQVSLRAYSELNHWRLVLALVLTLESVKI